MVPQNVFAFVKRVALNDCLEDLRIQPLTHARRNSKTSNACYEKTITQPITNIVWFTRICKRDFSLHYREK